MKLLNTHTMLQKHNNSEIDKTTQQMNLKIHQQVLKDKATNSIQCHKTA